MTAANTLLLLLSSTASLWPSHTLLVFPSTVTENKGSNVTLFCRENNLAQAQGIQWRVPSGMVYDPAATGSSARVSAVTYTLVITGLQSGDGGTYRCERKSNQSDYAVGTIRVTVPPYIVNPITLQQIVLGQTATINCQYNADASPVPTTYWYKGNWQVNDSRLSMVPGGLVIANVVSTDEANYTCIALSVVGSASLVITAVFRAPPQFVAALASSSVLIQKGSSGTLDCSAVGVPVPIYSWTAPPTVNPVGVTSSTLNVNAVDFSVSGTYTCTVLNSVGAINRSFDVFVYAPPYPSAYNYPPIAVQSDNPVVLNCQAVAMPQPMYSWFLYNSQNYQTYPIDSTNTIINGSTLTIMSFDSTTSAYSVWYLCLASNEYGESRNYFRLDVSLLTLGSPSLLATPTKEMQLAAVQGSGVGGASILPIVVGTIATAAGLLAVVLCSVGLSVYIGKSRRRKLNSPERQLSLEQSMRSTLSSTSEQSALFHRPTPSLSPVYSRLMLSSTSSQTSVPVVLGSFPSVDEDEDDGVFIETDNPAFQEVNPIHQEVSRSPGQDVIPNIPTTNSIVSDCIPHSQEADSLQEVNPAYLKAGSSHQVGSTGEALQHSALEVPVMPVYAEVLSKEVAPSGQSIYETIH